MKKKFCVFLALLLLTVAPTPLPARAGAYTAGDYEQSQEVIRKIVHQKDSFAEVDAPLYIAHIIALDAINECDLIESIHQPRLSPDQSMVFIGYFLRDEPDQLRVFYLRRPSPEAKTQIKNDSIENFNEFTYKHYRTKFYYVEPIDSTAQEKQDHQ